MLRATLPAPKGSYIDHRADEGVAPVSDLTHSPFRNSSHEQPSGGVQQDRWVVPYDSATSRKGLSSSVLNVELDSAGNVKYDAIARVGRSSGQLVQTSLNDTKERMVSKNEIALPTQEEEAATAERTRLALEAILSGKVKKSSVETAVTSQEASEQATYVRYTPNPNAPGYQASASQRVIKVVEAQVDPMEPAKHKIKKVPFKPDTDNVPVLHAPDKVTQAEAAAWKIPPMISNWKNESGFVISLDKRLAADGRAAHDVTINNKFAALSEALYATEKKAAEDLRLRNSIRRQVAAQEKSDKEAELRDLAARARLERAGVAEDINFVEDRGSTYPAVVSEPNIQGRRRASNIPAWMAEQQEEQGRNRKESLSGSPPDTPPLDRHEPKTLSGTSHFGAEDEDAKIAMQQREELREKQRIQRLREMRGGRQSKDQRDAGRDISERVALGQHTGSGGDASAEAVYDSRLFNQSSGLDSGFGADDAYEAYTVPMFNRGDLGSSLYRPTREEGAGRGSADEQLEALRNTTRFRPDKGFQGTEGGEGRVGAGAAAPRNGPVQFEKAATSSKTNRTEEDVFGIRDIVDAKRVRRE